jgi:HD-GYP domain-containing protein (c-di-GMP phosphodiesterase class II)
MDLLIRAIGTALDIVESKLLGASVNHGKRIAVLSAAMGRTLGMDEEAVATLAICALLHDNALTEYILSERLGGESPAMKDHCEFGERNVAALHLKGGAENLIRYHHERADGSGPYGIREGEGPLGAEIIAAADSLDVRCRLQEVEEPALAAVRDRVAASAGTGSSRRAAEAMLAILDGPTLLSLRDQNIQNTAAAAIPPWVVDVEAKTIFGLAGFMTRIIDYHSVFTRRHSTQIAAKAWFMGEYYGLSREERAEFFLAASLHDIGKLATPTAILEKPGKLTDLEFSIIKEHIRVTWEILKDIEGFETIAAWASNHHEKLDGSGYPFGKKAEDLDRNSRLLACIDIYQAVSEERPYHPGRNHADTMKILHGMADRGQVDAAIAADMDRALLPFNGGDVPAPVYTE